MRRGRGESLQTSHLTANLKTMSGDSSMCPEGGGRCVERTL